MAVTAHVQSPFYSARNVALIAATFLMGFLYTITLSINNSHQNCTEHTLDSWLKKDIRTDDHTGKPDTATFTTLASYLKTKGLLLGALVLNSVALNSITTVSPSTKPKEPGART